VKAHRDAKGKLVDQGRGKKDFFPFEGAKICHSKQGSSPLFAERSYLFGIILGIHHKPNCGFKGSLFQGFLICNCGANSWRVSS
jgi:hypothetical protein